MRKRSAADIEDLKLAFLTADRRRQNQYLDAYVATEGFMVFTGNERTMPFIGGGQNNLYKCFIDLAFRLTSKAGRAALIHQDNHLVDPKAAPFRQAWYARAHKHFQFSNALSRRMFVEVSHRKTFSLNIYRGEPGTVAYDHIAGLLVPEQVDECFSHDGIGSIPGQRSNRGEWDTRGHKRRVVRINKSVLAIIARLVEDENSDPLSTRFVMPHSDDTLAIFKQFTSGNVSFATRAGHFKMERLWDESGATKDLKVIRRATGFRTLVDDMIITGPMFYVGNPFYKCPKRICNKNADNEPIDLSLIDERYIPRTNYERATSVDTYRSKMTRSRFDNNSTHADQYRIAFRNMMTAPTERTLIAALLPPGVAHVNTVESRAFANQSKLVASYPCWISLPFDFLVKSTGLTHFREASLRNFPWADVSETAQHRALRLACLTEPYKELWDEFAPDLNISSWSSRDPRLALEGDFAGPRTWDRTAGLRTDLEPV